MAQSPEYPDLPWVPPKAWNSGRPDGPPLWIVIHTTEGSEGLTSAEDGAAYDARRTDGTSTHYFHDQDTTVQCVRTTDRANAAMGSGNRRGIHHELCGRAAQTPAQWHDAASAGTLRNAAKQAARDAQKHGIPVRRLTALQVRAGEKGFCEHNDVSLAFAESDHTDPGKNYPWTEFLAMVQEYMTGDDMPTVKDIWVGAQADLIPNWDPEGAKTNPSVQASYALSKAAQYSWDARTASQAAQKDLAALRSQVTTLAAAVAAITKANVDERAIIAGVLAGLSPATIAAAIPATVAQQVVDELAARLKA